MSEERLLAASDIAELLGVGPSAVSNWIVRHEGEFPKPAHIVSRGHIRLWRESDVLAWAGEKLDIDAEIAEAEAKLARLRAAKERRNA